MVTQRLIGDWRAGRTYWVVENRPGKSEQGVPSWGKKFFWKISGKSSEKNVTGSSTRM